MIRLITYSAIVMFAVGAAILNFFVHHNHDAGMLAITTAMFAAANYRSLERIERLVAENAQIITENLIRERGYAIILTGLRLRNDTLTRINYLAKRERERDSIQAKEPDSEKKEDPHPNKEEVKKGVAEGKAWQYRRKGTSEWINPTQPFGPTFGPTWNEKHDYRLVPIEEPPSKDEPNPHPNRAEVEAGIKVGKCWEVKRKIAATWTKARPGEIPIWSMHHDYRLTPEPEYVPLGPEDVPPGSVFRGAGEAKEESNKGWCIITSATETGIRYWRHCDPGNQTEYPWRALFDYESEINRSLPLAGKWDANAWEPCRKLKS